MKTWDELVEVVAKATAMYYAHNRMPVMSGNPLDRLHPSQKRDCYDGARAALSAIRAAGVRLMPEEASNAAAMAGLIAQGDAPTARDLGVSAMKAAYTAMVAADEIKPQEADLTARDGRNDDPGHGGTGNDATGL